jgi:hypothetical protein
MEGGCDPPSYKGGNMPFLWDGVEVKRGAMIRDLIPEMFLAIGFICVIFIKAGVKFVITSGDEPTNVHMPTSLHYSHKAIDIRTRSMTSEQLNTIMNELKLYLDRLGFDIVSEKDHIHFEYDPHPGDTSLIKEGVV